jgi:glycosyltransferase involved in cell wall biosynthesis
MRCSVVSWLDNLTPLILTYNEEANIARTLASLPWARRIVVVDSFSTDATLDILSRYPQVEVMQRVFDTHASQWNAGLDMITSGWVLSLDADYVIPTSLLQEMSAAISLADQQLIDGYRIPFRYCVFGKAIRSSVLPPRLALFRRSCGFYVDDGHTQDLRLRGTCSDLASHLIHDDRKPLSRWLWAQNRYLNLEVKKLLNTPLSELSLVDRLRCHTVLAPIAVLALCLIWRRGLLDGWRGWFYAFQRMYVETLLSLMLLEARRGY